MHVDADGAPVATTPTPSHSFAHPTLIAVVSSVALLVSGAVARQRSVSSAELRLTVWFNDAPDWVATLLYPIMQLGTLWAPLIVGVVLVAGRRDIAMGVATVAVGVAAWFVAKLVKSVVERGRPRQYLPGIDVRDATTTGFGYVSGHSAVAAATAVMVMAVLPGRWRPLAVALALLVGVARIVDGVHLPADVVGGWALGTLLALAAVTAVAWTKGIRTPPAG